MSWFGKLLCILCLDKTVLIRDCTVGVNGEMKCRVWNHLVKGWISKQYDETVMAVRPWWIICETIIVWSIVIYEGQLGTFWWSL